MVENDRRGAALGLLREASELVRLEIQLAAVWRRSARHYHTIGEHDLAQACELECDAVQQRADARLEQANDLVKRYSRAFEHEGDSA